MTFHLADTYADVLAAAFAARTGRDPYLGAHRLGRRDGARPVVRSALA